MTARYSHNVRNLTFLALLLVAMMLPREGFAQSREYLLKAGYIEKFTHFITWPEMTGMDDSTATLSIAVIGDDLFSGALKSIFEEARVNNKKVHITHISSIAEIETCMILIISESEKNRLDEILKYTTGKPILTIGDTKGYGKKGVIINMFIDANHVRYEINRTSLDKSGLRISSLLLASAVIVKTDE